MFIVSAAAILGLAWIVGLSTERLGALTGPQVGGILNATFGNIAELIIAFFALRAGLITVVQASITGSIIGNLLLVLGAAVLVGGLKNGLQTFSQRVAGSNAGLLALAAVGLFIPAVFAASGGGDTGREGGGVGAGRRRADRRLRALPRLAVHQPRAPPSAATRTATGTPARPGRCARPSACCS